ncbi:EAL domain-containing protein [Sinimarinibacterium sp. CAU 1509]|uniref:EAL domain-containing protein n=1 Tax=Sinimarinibacterium sp. CAU 1509 TaxID=2562283 RepID=UPI0010ABF120|nr:EAL domain-containing protein [Sinimarinibacterium sp. CAU 1509]TJY61877.1 EAL domain-containing protein [Sinimarinibacterium sp. CAU 1509]
MSGNPENEVLVSRLGPDSAMALFLSLSQPAALVDSDGETVLAVNAALVQRCGHAEQELQTAGLTRLRQLLHDSPPGDRDQLASGSLVPAASGDHPVSFWLAAADPREGNNRDRDPITGLHTKHAIEARIRDLLAAGKQGVLIRFEVDQFKLINDAFGREAGNHLLGCLGRLIASLLPVDQAPAHLGGDDFAVALIDVDVDRAWAIAEGVRLQIAAQGFEWGGRGYGVTTSIGIAAFADAFQDYGELMKAADSACEAAKTRGRNRIEIFHREDRELRRVRGEQSWGGRVLDALEDNRFALFRQRIEPLQSGVGREHWEILLRVRGASGWTSPVDFVVAAERYGLMPQMDRRVISRTLRELSKLPKDARPVMAINLSGNSLGDRSLAAYIERMLELNEVEPSTIRFEITETAAIANTSRAVELVNALRALGCRVALDDFGAGMSSFSYLKALEVDMIKIDGSFVRTLLSDAVDAATVESMVQIAALRGLQTVAECVEDAASLERLRELGVDFAQGFYLHRPEPWSLP